MTRRPPQQPPSDYSTPAGYGPPSSFGAFGHGPAYPPPPGGPVHPYGGGGGYGPPVGRPSSNIGWAIAAIFLFWPLAIPSFIYAGRVENQWFAGDWAGALSSSRSAKNYGLAAVIIGGVFLVLAILLIIVTVAFVGTAVSHLPTYSPAPYSPPS